MGQRVSILSQPEGRELLGATLLNGIINKFQSSPSPKAGSYRDAVKKLLRSKVSILSQPEGRELPAGDAGDAEVVKVSILSQPEGRELPERLEKITAEGKFQSSPSPKAGSYHAACIVILYFYRFNPLPARRPGATNAVIVLALEAGIVSILSQPEGRELRNARI